MRSQTVSSNASKVFNNATACYPGSSYDVRLLMGSSWRDVITCYAQ